ncbi:MAG: ABC transporter substrate-binding protein [Desulfobacterales bacterium]|nr:ABC transporter substrate-binding protein [Desulfobacterales bacterium]
MAVFLILTGLFTGAAWAAPFIKDQGGRRVSVAVPRSRIISLYTAHTENLFALGLNGEVIGISSSDDYPPEALSKPRYSHHDDPEKFLAARPDLVLVRPMIDRGYPDFIGQLERFGITVVSLQPTHVEEMLAYWKTLGRLTGKERAAEEMVTRFQNQVKEIRSKTQSLTEKKQVYFEAIHGRMKTFSQGAMALFALEAAGGINIAQDAKSSRGSNIANYGKEQILAKGGHMDVYLAQRGIMNPVTRADILTEPGFNTLKAVKNGQVYLIDETIVSRPVPRLSTGILTIGKILYPHLFTP